MPDNPLSVISRIRSPVPARPRPGERCEMCAADVADHHAHVVDTEQRRLLCACRPCALLFFEGGGRYRMVPDRYESLAESPLSPAQWDALQIPVSIAFFMQGSAFYPSPAGATESELPLEGWEETLPALEPDVEALLVREHGGGFECFIVPIDRCYELVGTLRRLWRGFDGGQEARQATEEFFADIRRRAGG